MTQTDLNSLTKSSPGRSPAVARLRDYGIVIALAILVLFLSLRTDAFLTRQNIENILNQQAPLMIIAVAGTLVVISGNFDISVGAVYALSGVVGAKTAIATGSAPMGLIAGVSVGLIAGLLNGLVVTRGRINSLIGTLASSSMVRGLAVAITGGSVVLIDDTSFTFWGKESLAGIKVAIWICLFWVALMWLLLERSRLGRYLFAVGDNSEAAELSGVNVNRVKITAFMLSGLAAGIGGVIAAARYGSGQADAAVGLEFAVIAAIVVGGTSVQGGQGSIWRTVVGVLLIAVIGNGFTLLGINSIYQQMVQGAIILAAVALDAWTRRGP